MLVPLLRKGAFSMVQAQNSTVTLFRGLPCPVVDCIIMRDDKEVPRGQTGELWL